MVSHPLHSVPTLFTGKDVETNLRPIVDTFCQLDGFMLLVVRWIDSVNRLSLAGDGVVGVQFDHQVLWCDRVRAIDLNLVVSLGVRNR